MSLNYIFAGDTNSSKYLRKRLNFKKHLKWTPYEKKPWLLLDHWERIAKAVWMGVLRGRLQIKQQQHWQHQKEKLKRKTAGAWLNDRNSLIFFWKIKMEPNVLIKLGKTKIVLLCCLLFRPKRVRICTNCLLSQALLDRAALRFWVGGELFVCFCLFCSSQPLVNTRM